jgi:4-oxalocrotonate tautomerase
VRLAGQIVKDAASILQAGEESISLATDEVEPTDWDDKVSRTEILNNPKLYKKPGCNPFGWDG